MQRVIDKSERSHVHLSSLFAMFHNRAGRYIALIVVEVVVLHAKQTDLLIGWDRSLQNPVSLHSSGVDLHIKYMDLLFRGMHDLAETPRTAFGDSGRTLSGAALEVEIQPLVQKVQRKRRVWDSVYRRRNALVLELLERFGGEPIGGVRRTVPVWGSVLPSDREALVREEVQLVSSQIHSRNQMPRCRSLQSGDKCRTFSGSRRLPRQ